MTSVDIETTNLAGFAAVVNSRLAAEAFVSRAKAFAWFSGGLAFALILTGIGAAFAFYGYSYAISVRPAADEVSHAFAKALEGTKLKTVVSGVMALSKTELILAPGQSVKLDPGATVKIDPNASVRVVGDLKLDLPQPSKQQLQLDTMSVGSDVPFTRYTIFKDVPYGNGEVVTGWGFELSDTTRPRYQYCYYTQHIDKGTSFNYTIAVNNAPRRPSALTKLSFDFDEALTNCVWFSGL